MTEDNKTSPVQPTAKKGMSTGAKVGIGIGAGCCLIVIIIIVLGSVLGWNISKIIKKQQAYITEFQTINDDTANAYNELNSINDKYPNFSDTDLGTIDKNTVTIENAYDRLLKLDVPSDYQEINEMYKKGLMDFKEAMPIYRQAIRTKNNNELLKAADIINKGAEELKQAKTKIEEKNK